MSQKNPEKQPESAPVALAKTGKKKLIIIFLVSVLLLIAIASAGAWYVWNNVILHSLAVPGPSNHEQTFVVAPGAGANTIAYQLEDKGLISHVNYFRIKMRLAGEGVTLKAGEYLIPANASIDDIFAQLQAGKIIHYLVTIAEGRTSREIMGIVRDSPVLSGEIKDVPPEGSLLPESYSVTRNADRQALIARMQTDMTTLLESAWEGRDPDLPLASKEEALILASIVEKETGIAGERPQVAAVFINRLRRPMRLESDPTILYGLNGGRPLGRGLRRSEIARKTAWNTYQIDGLPPTPICNPGRDAIMAVLHPAKTKDLYFVADGSGGHVFASTYRAHLRNVAQWRKIERRRKRAKR